MQLASLKEQHAEEEGLKQQKTTAGSSSVSQEQDSNAPCHKAQIFIKWFLEHEFTNYLIH